MGQEEVQVQTDLNDDKINDNDDYMKVQQDVLHDRRVPGGLYVPEVLLSQPAGRGKQSRGGGLAQPSCGSIHRIIHRYTYYALKFQERVELKSTKTMGDFLEVCPKRLCISTVVKRTDLFNRDLHKVPITDFFGSVRSVVVVENFVYVRCGEEVMVEGVEEESRESMEETFHFADRLPIETSFELCLVFSVGGVGSASIMSGEGAALDCVTEDQR